MKNIKYLNEFVNNEDIVTENVVDIIEYLNSNKIKINKYIFKDEENYEFIIDNNEFTLTKSDDELALFKNGNELSINENELEELYNHITKESIVKESHCSILKKKKKKKENKEIISEGFLNKDNKEIEYIKDFFTKNPDTEIRLLVLKMYFFINDSTYCLNFFEDDYYTLYKDDLKLKISVNKVKELKEFLLNTSINIDDSSKKKYDYYDPDVSDYEEEKENDRKRKKNEFNKISDEYDEEAKEFYESENILSFEDFLNEAKGNKENLVIKDIIELIEENKDLKVTYKENTNPKYLVDIEFKFQIGENKYSFVKQKNKHNETTITITKNGEKVLSEEVTSRSLKILVTKLDSLLINLYRKKEKVTEELNTDNTEFSDTEQVFDEDEEIEDNTTEEKEVENEEDEEVEEEDVLDDLKSNFRSWEQDCNDEDSAEELLEILIDRHPNEDKEYLKDLVYDWVGCKIDSNEQQFEKKRLKSYKGFQYITDDEDERIAGYEYRITHED